MPPSGVDEQTRRSLWLTAIEHGRDIILIIDAETGALVDANRAAEQAYGELRGRTVFDLRGDAAVVSEQMVTANEQGILFEAMHRRADGSQFPVEVSSRGHTIGGRRYLISIIRDISERRTAEEERERLLVATQQALAARDEFLSVASHELRTPITIAHLQLHRLRRLVGRDVDVALGQLDRLDALVDRLLDASKVEARIDIQYADVDLADIVRDATERLRAQTAAGSTLTVDVPSLRGSWDPLRLEQVVTNLVANAFKYGEDKPILVSASGDDELVYLEVRDHGIGLQPGDLERIFEKFVRAVPPTHYGGLGLGLYIARQIVEAHCGWLEASSTPGEGALFRVTLPRRRPR